MQQHDNLGLMGQDTSRIRWRIQDNRRLCKRFWQRTCTPIHPFGESAIVGSASAFQLEGLKHDGNAVCRFCNRGFNQIINNLAKIHYRWGQNADVVIRMPSGAAGRWCRAISFSK